MSVHLFTGASAPAPTGIAIRPPEWWEAKYSMAGDLSYFGQFVSADSLKHYTLGLSVGGNARMGWATGKAAYFDRAYYYLQSIMALATNAPSGYKVWYGSANGNKETSLYEIYCWRFAPDLLLPTKGVPAYSERWTAVHAFLEKHIWEKWMRYINAEIYRSVLHIASHWAKLGLYLRTEGSTAEIRAQANTICANISHAGMTHPSWRGANMYSQVRKFPHPIGGAETAFWPAYWTGTVGVGGSEPYGSDSPHGVAIGTFVSEAMRLGFGPWSVSDDLPRFIRLRDIIYNNPKPTCWSTLNPGGVGADGKKTWGGKTAEFGCLAQFDRNFQKWLENDESRGIADGAEKFGTFALNAARLGGPYL